MAISLLDQETQIRRTFPVSLYNDSIAPSEANFETNPVSLLDDLNSLRSQIHTLLDNRGSNWFGDLATPSALETGSQRGVNDLNAALHALEKKRVLRDVCSFVDVTVGAGNNFVILGTGELPTNTTAAVGGVTTLGTVVAAHGGTFGTHALSEIPGANAISPLNLMQIVDGNTRDDILSDNRKVYGLLQGESGLTDGATITDTTTTRVQISFVRVNATGDDLEAVPFADVENRTINYCTRERVRQQDLNEYDFLTGAIVDVPGTALVTRQAGYGNQGTTPVDVLTSSFLDLEAAGVEWTIRDNLEASLFRIIEGSAGGTSEIEFGADVDIFDNNASVNDFLNGASFDTGSIATTINVGVTPNQIDAGGVLTVASGGGADLTMLGAGELYLDDGNRTGSTWATLGLKLSETTLEWSNLETIYGGEKSLIQMLIEAKASTTRRIVYAVCTVDANADVDVSGPSNDNNLDTDLGNLSGHDFGLSSTKLDIYLNGAIQVQDTSTTGANDKDVYPGTSLANGQLKFEKKIKVGDVIYIVDWLEIP